MKLGIFIPTALAVTLSMPSPAPCRRACAADNTPPPGFSPLFNGKYLAGWDLEHDAERHWAVTNGMIEYDGRGRNLRTAADYGNFELWVDWKIPAGGDSGIYLRGFPQVQIWDNPVGSGGLYNNRNHPSKPLVVADNPPGEWNTFRIRLVEDVATVHLNDRLVVDNTVLECWPNYDSKLPALGRIELQHHGSQLWFKNIYIKELPPLEWGDADAPPADFTQQMKERIKDAGPTEKAMLLRVLAKYSGTEALPVLLEAARAAEPAVRIAAIEALGQAGGADALPILAEAACSINRQEQAAARSALAALKSPEAEHEMLARLADASEQPEIRREMVFALAARRCAAALPAILEAARDRSREVRMACFSALPGLAGTEALPALLGRIENAADDEERAAVSSAAAEILIRSGRPEQGLEMLCAAYARSDSLAERSALLAAMGITGGAHPLAVVHGALKTDDPGERHAALRAMAGWPDSGPIDDLLAAAAEWDSPELRALALAGHARMTELALEAGLISPEQACRMYENAFDLAEQDEERRVILERLGRAASPDSLRFLEQALEEIKMLGQDNLLPAAEAAYVKTAASLLKSDPASAKTALRQFCASSENRELVEAAARALEGK